DQLLLVDTALPADEVAARIEAALAAAGIDEIAPADTTYYVVGGDGIGFTATSNGGRGIGHPRYQVEGGGSDDHPGLLAVYLDLAVDLEGALPSVPASSADYFAETQAVGEAEGWTPTRWYAVEGRAIATGEMIFRGELDWVTADRGPDGL